MNVKKGDFFLTTGSWISWVINKVQTWWSPDGKSLYTHAGIITNENGDTLEIRGHGVERRNLDVLRSSPLLIARNNGMTNELFEQAVSKMKLEHGRAYPIWRLFLYLLPPLTRLTDDDQTVCSEFVSQFLFYAGLIPYWRGVSPDSLHEMIKHWRNFEIIQEINR